MTVSYFPVSNISDLQTLDQSDVIECYLDGFKNEPKPSGNRSRSYYHGWRNGMMDGGFMQPDKYSITLAREFIENHLWWENASDIHDK